MMNKEKIKEKIRMVEKTTEIIREDVHGIMIKANMVLCGHIECPVCKNDLYYSVAGINGHISGECQTKNCLVWGE